MLKHKKLLSAIAVLLSSACLLAGCGGPKGQESASPITFPEDGSVYPMVCEDELTVWATTLGPDQNESPFGKALQAQTGAKLKFEQPVGGMEALNTLLASGELPDIIISDLSAAPGGVAKMVEDEVVVELDEYLKAYAPNLMAYLKAHPEVDKQIKSDDGHYYFFPMVREDERLTSSQGLAIRKDMLDKAGLAVPTTVDEWTAALTAFKEQGASAPLSFDMIWGEMINGFISGAYDVKGDYYIDNGTVKYGFMEDKMIDAIKLYKKWYDEGLLDHNIVSVPDLDGQIIQGETAASIMWAGSGLGKYMNAVKDGKFELVAAPAVVLNKGDVSRFGNKGFLYSKQGNAYISTDCKNIELAVRMLDYGYGEAGINLFNYGIEGESFTFVDGVPTYTNTILKPDDGKSISEAMQPYLLASGSMPSIQQWGYLNQYYQLQQQKDAVTVWSQCNSTDTMLPNLTFTTEESDRLAEITTNVTTCSQEMLFKFITGAASLDDYDDFKAQLEGYGVNDALEIYQAAYDRYLKR